MLEIHPTTIPGPWITGFALDAHTLSSEFLGEDEQGRPRYRNIRSPMGEALYRLKYRNDVGGLEDIVETAAAFLRDRGVLFEAILPMPPTKIRAIQPVMLIASRLASAMGLSYEPTWIQRAGKGPQMKDLQGLRDKREAPSSPAPFSEAGRSSCSTT